MKEAVGAAHYHINDLMESIKVTDVKGLNKNEIAKQVLVWENNVAVAESLLREALKPKEEE